MPPKFATPYVSKPASGETYSKSQNPGNGANCKFTWENKHGLTHGAVIATHWKIWIGINAGGGEKYKTQNEIVNNGNINSDPNVPSAALPIGVTLWVTPKYKKSDGTWNEGTPTQFKVAQ